MKETLLEALQYLVLISEVEEIEIFKICLEYWNILAAELYREVPYQQSAVSYLRVNNSNTVPTRRQFYGNILSKVRSNGYDGGRLFVRLLRFDEL